MNTQRVRNMDAVVRSRLVTVSVDTSLLEAAKHLSDTQVSLVVVCNAEGVMAGVITKTDIVKNLGDCVETAGQTLAADLMVCAVSFCRPDDLLSDVIKMMDQCGFVHLPVVDANHKPVGVVNARDALKVMVSAGKYEESLLRDYVMGVGYH